jgi:glutamate-5-semialdehyde dehydrogenase
MAEVRQLAERAKVAARFVARLDRRAKDRALTLIAERLRAGAPAIQAPNARDIERARAAGLTVAMVDRLDMGPKVVEATARGVEHIAGLDDPIGSRSGMHRLANGLLVGRQRLPLGVIAMVYESRPNVTVDAAALCLKAGNAVLLRGGKEASETNAALGELLRSALSDCGLPPDAIVIVPPDSRENIKELVSLSVLVEFALPRGGEGLIVRGRKRAGAGRPALQGSLPSVSRRRVRRGDGRSAHPEWQGAAV